ncbi:caspase-3-like [Haliotis asinina]|uniref:caspase-3-like n=1 Tax=Haliotis asinina TaxID=109174 RepID=UPI00353278C1
MDSTFCYWTLSAFFVALATVIMWWLKSAPPGPRIKVIANDGGKCGTSMAFGSIGDADNPLPNEGSLEVTANKGGESEYALAAMTATESAFQTAWQAENSAAKDPEGYKMEAKPRGLCLIINNITFVKEIPSLHSAQEITERLDELFKRFHFKTLPFTDMSADSMMERIRSVAVENHSQYDCFVCFVLTHGADGILYGSDGKKVQLEEFISAVSGQHCPTLEGKPKLFFIDACRTECPIGAALKSLSEFLSSADDDGDPELIDYFVGYSTQKYKKAYRNNESGNVYTTTFISVMNDLRKRQDLLNIMTKVNKIVKERGVYDREGVKWSQFPDMWIKLRKTVYF